MFSVLLTDAAMQSLLPLADCYLSPLQVVPFLKQSFFEMINITGPAAIYSLMQNAPDRDRRYKQLTSFSLGI